MATGWTEETCFRMNALAAEGHSHVATSAEQERHDNLLSLNSPRSTTHCKIHEAKKMEVVAARQVFHSHIPVEDRIRQRQKQKCNLKERAQVQEKLLLGPSIVVHRGRVGGLHPTQKLVARVARFELVVNSLHTSFFRKNVLRVSV